MSSNSNFLGALINKPLSKASFAVVTIGNSSISILINFFAFLAIGNDSATIKAIGCPIKCTSFSANRGSSGIIPPI